MPKSSIVYREERLTVRKRGGTQAGRSARVPRCCSPGTATSLVARFRRGCIGRRQAVPHPGVVDDFSRECLALVVDTSLSGVRVARELDRIVELAGPPPHAEPATTAPSSPQTLSCAGSRNAALAGTTSHRASPCKTALSNLQRPPARRVPQRTSLRLRTKRGGSSRNGGTTTNTTRPPRAWMGSHPTSLQPAPMPCART